MMLLTSGLAFCNAQKIYKGKIIDEITRQPIEYVNISSVLFNKTTATDRFGNFQIVLSTDTATLTIVYLGYDPQEIKVFTTAKRNLIILKRGSIDLKEVRISPNLNDAAFHTLSNLDLNIRPVNSSQDLMRLVPGLFIAQHMGGGKAEQIFIRGFDADHGSDLNVSVDGIPVNMVSHIHGQGYADLHYLIPETVSAYDFGKGPYYTDHGDFTTAGYLSYYTRNALDKSIISLEAGQFHTLRAAAVIDLLGNNARLKGTNAYIAGEYNYTNGQFTVPEHYKRFNLFGKFTKQLNTDHKLSVSVSTFSTGWVASGEIPERAVAAGTNALDDNGKAVKIPAAPVTVSRYGTIDSAQGGKSTRNNVILKLTSDLKNNLALENQVYYTHYTFDLDVNSTFFADDSLNGDQRQQHESRDLYGFNSKLTKSSYFGKLILNSALGIGTRFDSTYGTEYSKVTGQYKFLEDITKGSIRQNNSSIFLDEVLESGKWLFNLGARLDYFNFNYHDTKKVNLITGPKLNIQYTANTGIQFYIKAGKGFHSNNAIAVVGNNGLQTLPAAYATDLGLNWKPIPHLYINVALWYLYLQQEFVYTDDGSIAPGGKTKRKGIDLSARYQLFNWLYADLNVNLASSRFADSTKNTAYLPLAPGFTSTGGLDFKFVNGINGGLSYRYIHSRPGNNANTLIADGYFITDMKLNYTQKRYEVGLTIENLLNTRWNEFEAERVSRLRAEAKPIDQMSFTPGIPFFSKIRVAMFF